LDDFSDRVWLALVEGKQTGPLDARALADWVGRGHVTVQTYFWRRGMPEWRRGAELPELAHVFGTKMAERRPALPAIEPPLSGSGASTTDLVPPPPSTDAVDHETTEETSLGISGIWNAPRKGGRRTIAAALVGGLSVFGLALFVLTNLGSVALRGGKPTARDGEQIARVVVESRTALQGCIAEALRQDPDLRVPRFHLVATISSSGVVRQAAIDRREIEASALGECLKVRARRMVFAPFGDEDVQVEVPLTVGTDL
jgi:hypothetical protein